MGTAFAKLGIDWSNASTFLMLWIVLSFLALGFIEPRHGGWNRRVQWFMNTPDPVPDWFPVPVFHADPDRRVIEGLESALEDDVHIILGVTTYPEWVTSGSTLRVSEGGGKIVEMRRDDVVVMPIEAKKQAAQLFQFRTPVAAQPDRGERFPADLSGFLHREEARLDNPEFDVISMHAQYERGVWAKATLFRYDDGSLVPESAILHLRGLSQAAAFGMTKAAFFGAIPAFFGTWALQAMSRAIGREAGR